MERFTYNTWISNPKYKWWNKEPKFINQAYFLKVDAEGYVCALKQE